MGLSKVFLFMKKAKKSVVGHAVHLLSFSGENNQVSSASNARIVKFFLHVMHLKKGCRIDLFGLENGY
ncbi:MAG TPA: hypothetical protein VER14_08215 [Phototrophicaceae bacterium]|nr:hypothetical protein [Phototrophicaceae bacterium]